MRKTFVYSLLSLGFLLTSCGQDSYRLQNVNPFVSTQGTHKVTVTKKGVREDFTSSSAGNLMATAIREVHDLDVVMYPADLINEENVAFASAGMTTAQMDSLLGLYPNAGNKDQFLIGVMKGRDISKLLRTRVLDTFKLDIEVAGMVYQIHTVGGIIRMENYGLDNGRNFEDSETYRVAINNHFFFSGETFPSYKFRNGLNFSFVPNGQIVSAKNTLQRYMSQVKELPYLEEPRGRYSKFTHNSVGFKRTFEIQGNGHLSPYWAHKATTRGIVTAVDNVEWYPRGIDIIIQDPEGDGRDQTSDALHVHLDGDQTDVKVGDEIEVSGTVFEHVTLDKAQDMTKTVMRDIDSVKILRRGQKLPDPVIIGKEGRPVPQRILSTWVGNLNFKPELVLTDGIDFWESLEGMRVLLKNPRITGFRGGNEELVRLNPQRHLSLYIVPDGFSPDPSRTLVGGQTEDFMAGNYNPEVLQLSAGNLTADHNRLNETRPRINFNDPNAVNECQVKGGMVYTADDGNKRCKVPNGLVTTEYHYNVGDVFKGDIVGILSFESNLFGGGEYTLVLPEPIYRYDTEIPNGKDWPCVVYPHEYLNKEYESLFSDNIQNVGCSEIMEIRELISENPSGQKYEKALEPLLKESFDKNTDGSPKETINCASVDFFRTSMPFECRPQAEFKGKDNQLTVATYNLENLAGNQDDRIKSLGMAIRHSMKCPDILSLVEIQDDNGLDLQGGADAKLTLQKVIDKSKCGKEGVLYKAINVNPVNHNEGGQPGGNIRVAMLYNAKRVNYSRWGQPTDGPLIDGTLQETRVTQQGNLSVNPGRVFPNSDAFKNTRKSIVVQFEFRGEKVFVIGNHFNSKLGDTSFWGAQQPPYPGSDDERALLAAGINEFVRIIEMREPNANVVVVGDFNAQYNERSMRTLENGGVLTNLMFHGNLVAPNDRYSHNYNGSSAAIDFIFANKNLMKKQPKMNVLHINSDYMGRLSDHDPAVSLFSF